MIKVKDEEIEALFEFIKHGGKDHQEWLREALYCYFNSLPKPTYKE